MARKMKDETAGVPNKEFFRFKPKIRSFFVVDSSEYKKAKSVNKNVDATLIDNDYKHVLLNNKCLRHLMNKIQSKDHRMGAYEINKMSLSCFGITYLNNYQRLLSCQVMKVLFWCSV